MRERCEVEKVQRKSGRNTRLTRSPCFGATTTWPGPGTRPVLFEATAAEALAEAALPMPIPVTGMLETAGG